MKFFSKAVGADKNIFDPERMNNYISLIENELNARVVIADTSGISELNYELNRFFISRDYHNNPYCNYLKKIPSCFFACVSNKSKVVGVCNKSKRAFCGGCTFGVYEYVFPVFLGNTQMALIFIGGFRKDTFEPSRFDSHPLPEGTLQKIKENHFEFLSPLNGAREQEIIDKGMFLSQYLCNFFRLIILKSPEDEFDINSDSTYIKYHDENIVNRTTRFIQCNYPNRITLDILSIYASCNASYLSHLFKLKTGQNLSDYINEVRLNKAKILLSSGNDSITNIAYACGYNQSAYFTKIFKEHFGVTPKEYRNNIDKGL